MQVTNVKLYKSNFADGGTKAFGQLEIDNAIVMDIEVREKQSGEQWVCFPGYKTVKDKQGGPDKKQSRIFIKDDGLKAAINAEVIGKYNREIRQGAAAPGATTTATATNAQTPFPF